VSPLNTYEMYVRTTGNATVVAATKKEAREKAERGEYATIALRPAHPDVSTIKKRQ
jgi:hypothetical protein